MRVLVLAATVGLTGAALGLLLGLPSAHVAATGSRIGLVAARLTDAGLRQTLTWCCWGSWMLFTLVAAPLAVGQGRRAAPARGPALLGAARPAAAAIANPYRAAAVMRAGIAAPARRGDTMGAPLVWDERPTDPGGRSGRGSAEARMTTDSTDGGTVLGGDRREPASRAQHEIPREDDRSYRAGRVDAQDTGKPAPEAGTAPAPAPPVPPGGVVRVPLAARGDASISLVALGSLALLGSADDVDDALCSMVIDAASGRVGEPVDVVLVGFGEEMHGLDGVVAVADEEEALRLARSATPPAGHTRAATVFFVGVRRHAGALRELVGLAVPVHAHPGPPAEGPVPALEGVDGARARSVVVAGELVEARWRLDLHAASLEEGLVRQLGRTVPPAARDEEELPNAPTTPSIEVSVLGPVRVAGAAVPLERRPKLTELVVYLAMHPEGATSDAWATALWPDRRMPMSTLSNRVSETRLALGQAPDGFAHLRKCGTRYHLGPFVSTDWDRFQALKAGDDPAGWREALALVRGRPFEGLREAQWTLLEGAVPAIESAVVELACRLAEHLLRARDPEGAEWAARRAMLACPWDERLYRLVMRAADAAGNRAGVEAALRQLACVLELGEEPLGAVHPETATLYRSLTSRRAVL